MCHPRCAAGGDRWASGHSDWPSASRRRWWCCASATDFCRSACRSARCSARSVCRCSARSVCRSACRVACSVCRTDRAGPSRVDSVCHMRRANGKGLEATEQAAHIWILACVGALMLSEAKGLEVGQEQVRLAEGYVQLPMHQVRTRLWQLPRLPVILSSSRAQKRRRAFGNARCFRCHEPTPSRMVMRRFAHCFSRYSILRMRVS